MNLVNDPALAAQVKPIPPRVLVIDGIERRLNRRITIDEAHRFAKSGLRTFFISAEVSTELAADRFVELLNEYDRVFRQAYESETPEAFIHVFGRRKGSRAVRDDTRIVVATIIWPSHVPK